MKAVYMTIEIGPLKGKKPGMLRWRRLSAVAGVAILACAGTALAASPASADTICNTYHNWVECINFGGSNLTATAYNYYSTTQREWLWVNSTRGPLVSIPSGGAAVVSTYVGYGPVYACAGIEAVQIVCGAL
jgi:hypothetical protein